MGLFYLANPGLHDVDFFVRQSIELVHQLIDLAVNGINLDFQHIFSRGILED